MSLFAFPPIEPATRMPIGRVDVPLGEWTGFRYREAAGQTMGGRLGDLFDELTDNSPYLPPDKANSMFGVPDLDGLPNSGLKFDKPIRHETAMHRNRRKLQELEDINVRELASHSNFGWKAWGSFALGALPGSMSHPLDIAVNFIPFVGSATKAEALAAKGAGAFRQSLARGLYTTEQIAQYTRFAPLATAIINGAAGNAFAEIPVAIQNFRDQRIYGFKDAALNVAVGGVAGGALHVAFRGVGKVFDALSPETRNRVAKTAIAQAMAGQEIDVRNVVSIDRDAIRAVAQFDEVAVRQEIKVASKELETINAKIEELDAKGEDTLELQASRQDILEKYPDLASKPPVEQRDPAQYSVDEFSRLKPTEGPEAYVQRAFDNRQPISAELAEVTGVSRQLEDADYVVVGDTYRHRPDIAASRKAQMEQNIESAMNRQRELYDAKAVEQRMVEEAIKTQQALGKVMSDEDVKTFTQKDVPDPADVKALEDDVKNLEDSILGRREPLVEQDVEVRVKQMKDGKVVSGTVTMKPKAALKALEGRAKILKQLMDCLNG